MRPIKLTMSAFGPYAKKIVIDFDKFGRNGIYLITGDTGAGKTTVFDGISYALFGNTSGDVRDDSMLRSKYAEDNQETYVELIFENNGKKYRVKRNPEYLRPSKRDSQKMVSQKQDAELHLPDETVITQKNRVNEKIEEILGVNRNQFSQIAMIAQGEFRKLLLADTKERQQIFRKIFKTNIYQAFQMETSDALKAVNNERAKLKTGIDQYIKGIMGNGNQQDEEKIKAAKEDEMPLGEIIDFLDELIKKDEKKLGENKENLENNNGNIDKIQGQLDKIQQRKLKEESLEKILFVLKEQSEKSIQLKAQLTEMSDNKERVQKINGQIVLLEKELDSYNELDKIKEEHDKLVQRIANLTTKEEMDMENLKNLKNQLEKLSKKLESLGKVGENLIDLKHKKDKLKVQRKELEEYSKQLEDFRIIEETLKDAQVEYLKAQEKADISKADAEKMRRAFNNEQAGILAETLENNMPCPVCGSLDHPNKAIITENAPSKKQVEKAEEDSRKALEKANKKSIKAGEIKGQHEAKFNEIEKKKEDLLKIHGGYSENFNEILNDKIKDLNKEIENIKENIEAEEGKVREKENLENIIPRKTEELKLQEEQYARLREEIITVTTEANNLEKQIIELKGKLNFDSGAELKANVLELKKQAKILTDQYDFVEKNLKDVEGNMAQLEGQKKTVTEDLEKLEVINKDGLEEQIAHLKEISINLEKEGKEIFARHKNNNIIKDNLNENADKQIQLDEKWQWIKAIADTANGKISGKERIMLETYVQMTYFDRIIRRANIHFMKMSGGQYDLVRNQNAGNKQSQTGLELDVIDHYNGSVRSVKSLSGGESFIASLSLALGLSEEIQASAGGIKLDTMFVDEGFGSLDEETLEQAMKALYSLAEENRTIGIISHVAELRREIDNQIVVTKDKTGSKVEIVV